MDQKPPSAKRSAGLLLKEERERQGLSLETVHEATKIPMDVLRAIEEGYNLKILTPFYYKGFLKIYGQYLSIDVQNVINEIPQPTLSARVQSAPQESLDIQKWFDENLTSQRKRQILTVMVVILAVFVTLKIFGFIKHKWATRPKKVVKIQEVKTAEDSIKSVEQVFELNVDETVSTRASVETTSPKLSTSVNSALVKSVSLTVRALKDSWLRVKVDGKVVYQSTLMRGAVETWHADAEIQLTGKNINQLEFELNGKMIGGLGRKNRLAKEVVFTKDGLTVVR